MTVENPNDYHPDELVTRSAAEPTAPAKRRQADRFLTSKAILGAVGELMAEERAKRQALEARITELERAIAELKGRDIDRRLRAVVASGPAALIA